MCHWESDMMVPSSPNIVLTCKTSYRRWHSSNNHQSDHRNAGEKETGPSTTPTQGKIFPVPGKCTDSALFHLD